jgi:mRNA interferase HicA
MEYATFRKWLTERGCRFDTQQEQRGHGHGSVTIHREGRTATLPLVGSNHELDPNSLHQGCDALGLRRSDLPRAKGHSEE